MFYRFLATKNPVDISVQEETGYLYYLYADEFLTNAHAGTTYEYFPDGKYRKILVNKEDQVLLIGDKEAALYQHTKKVEDLKLPKGDLIEAYVFNGQLYYLTSEAIYTLENGDWNKLHSGQNLTAITFIQNEIFIGTSDGYYSINLLNNAVISEKNNKLPVLNITMIQQVGSRLWFGSDTGAFLRESKKFRYFGGRRWWDNNNVIDITSDAKGDIYFLTSTGLNKVKYINQTLAQKTAKIQDDIRKYHMHFGWVNEIRYKTPRDIKTAHSKDNDNDGLWTTLYLGSQAFRYATTGEQIVRRYVWESFESFERLLTVNSLKGFPLRTFERRGISAYEDAWRPSKKEVEWDWKVTTSSDEYIGYLFIASVMNEFVAENKDEKERITNFIDASMTHIIENDYYFLDCDRKPTKWGRWNLKFDWYPLHVSDRKLNSADLITGFQLAYDLTEKNIRKKLSK